MELRHHPRRKELQIDRLILFTDAVFAIAITLLIIEIHVPEIPENGGQKEFTEGMIHLIPKFLGFFISFFLIGLYWMVHHRMFGYVTNYTTRLIWLNMFFLLSNIMMPFSNAVYSEYSTTAHYSLVGPYAVYVFNICFTGIMNYFLLRYIFNPKNKVAEYLPEREAVIYSKRRALAIPAVFLASLALMSVLPDFGRMLLFTIPFVMRMLKPKKRSNITIEESQE